MHKPFEQALSEISGALSGVDPQALEIACDLIANARRTGLYGCGREALQLRGFAMRLYHLGLDASYIGEMNTPPLLEGDLLFASAGPGELATVRAMMQTAKDAGARVLFVTATPETPSAALADEILVVPAQTMANDTAANSSALLPMGSVYEGALFLVFEIMIDRLRGQLGETAETMRSRHTNME